ncbi:MAG: hypothetical protein K8R99_01490 [Actinomycetia bacterium]|nr:hypothetical protein [Actinomycetes bacterium]
MSGVAPRDVWGSAHDIHRGWRAGTAYTVYLHDDVHLKVQFGQGEAAHLATASFEFCVPRVANGDNLHPVDLPTALSQVEAMYQRARRYVNWSVPSSHLDVMRLDLALNCLSPSPTITSTWIEAISRLRGPYHPKVERYSNVDGYTSLRRGSPKRWFLTAYDKAEELLSKANSTNDPIRRQTFLDLSIAATGVLRLELQLRRPVLVDRGIRTLTDLTPSILQQFHRRYVEQMQFHREVGGMTKVKSIADTVDATERLPLATLIGSLWLEAQGVSVEPDPRTKLKYRRMAEQYDLSVADFVNFATTQTIRLDYDNARLIVRDAT